MQQIPLYHFARQQRGAVLIVSLILLIVMTLLAIGGSQMTRMQERIASSSRNHDLAMQAAEAGLRAGERRVAEFTFPPPPCNAAPCANVYELGALTRNMGLTYEDQAFQDRDWWVTYAQEYAAGEMISGDDGASVEPLFYIEEMGEVQDFLSGTPTGPPPARTYYRITAMGQGGTNAAQVVLQSTFARRFP
jgi:type IV pilus assembly protein PilX